MKTPYREGLRQNISKVLKSRPPSRMSSKLKATSRHLGLQDINKVFFFSFFFLADTLQKVAPGGN